MSPQPGVGPRSGVSPGPVAARVVVFGDVIDDLIVVPRGPIQPDTDTPSSITGAQGGSAANVASWLGHLGVPVDFVGQVGAADVARHRSALAEHRVDAHLAADPELPTGAIVILVDGEHRNMLTSRGANSALDPESVTDELLSRADVLHLTGYSVMDSADPVALERLFARAAAAGVVVTVDPASAGDIERFGTSRFLAAVAGASVLFPNLDEGRILTDATSPTDIARLLAARFEVVALTLGRDGVVVCVAGREPISVAAAPASIVDPTGAGDAFAAAFIADWRKSHDPVAAAEAAVVVASRAITSIGARPRTSPHPTHA